VGERHLEEDPVEAGVGLEPGWANAEQERDARLREVQGSGPAQGARLVAIRALELEWTELLRAPVFESARLSAWRCYENGCVATLTSKDPDAIEKAADALLFSPAIARIGGQSFRSGPISNGSGEVEITWIVGMNSAVALANP
jgi:hypothetical protein